MTLLKWEFAPRAPMLTAVLASKVTALGNVPLE
jgi:hypothetical protein